ncbi:MAG: DUF4093 domain-containing protein [Clostridia bacterium]
MLKIKEIIIVEGKYDKNKLKQFIDGVIIETNGFRIFKDKAKQKMIRDLGQKNGVIVLTDSDSAGFVIRNFLKSILPQDKIKNVYIPEILGKEKRKESASKEGLLGVEGMEVEILKKALNQMVYSENTSLNSKKITKADLFVDGLSGDGSSIKRGNLIEKLGLPKYITPKALLEYLNLTMDFNSYKVLISQINSEL